MSSAPPGRPRFGHFSFVGSDQLNAALTTIASSYKAGIAELADGQATVTVDEPFIGPYAVAVTPQAGSPSTEVFTVAVSDEDQFVIMSSAPASTATVFWVAAVITEAPGAPT